MTNQDKNQFWSGKYILGKLQCAQGVKSILTFLYYCTLLQANKVKHFAVQISSMKFIEPFVSIMMQATQSSTGHVLHTDRCCGHSHMYSTVSFIVRVVLSFLSGGWLEAGQQKHFTACQSLHFCCRTVSVNSISINLKTNSLR